MSKNDKKASRGGLEEDKGAKLSVEGECPCIVVFPDRKHVDYIYNIVNCVEALLSQEGFKVYKLSDDALPDEHFGKEFEELAEECVLGVVILDGFRPNVLYEYGLLKGKGRVVIPIQDKKAVVAIKSFYSIPEGSNENVIKTRTGLTKTQFNHLKEPSIGYFRHLSDRHGIHAIVVDCGARLDSPDYPQNRIKKEIGKLMPKIVEKFSEQSLKPIHGISPEYLLKFHTLTLKISEYHGGITKFSGRDIENAINEIRDLEESSGVNMPSRVYSTVASLYLVLADETEWKNVDQIVEYYRKALGIHERILEFETNHILKSDAQKKIGDIYFRMAKYRDIKENCEKAIEAYKEALKVYNLERFPTGYAMTQNNIGNAYGTLADVRDKEANLKLAIKAYKEALKVYSKEVFPVDYAMTQNNIGTAYGTLADVRDKEANAKLAIEAFKEALKIRTKEVFPVNYAMTQNNIGTAYRTLAEVRDKEANAKLAIKAFKEALKIRTKEVFPVDYATTQNNIGNAYGTLAGVRDKEANLKLAIKAYKEALKVYNLERFPTDYAMTQNNIGNAYRILADVRDKEANAKLAIEAFKEALKIRTKEVFPVDYAMTQNNIGNAYRILADVRDKEANLKLAIEAFKEALKIRTKEVFPVDYATTQNNIGNAYGTLAEIEDKAKNCKRGIKSYKEALKVFTTEEFPENYQLVKSNLKVLLDFCKDK